MLPPPQARRLLVALLIIVRVHAHVELGLLQLLLVREGNGDEGTHAEVALAVCAAGGVPAAQERVVAHQLLLAVDDGRGRDHEGAADVALADPADGNVQVRLREPGRAQLGLQAAQAVRVPDLYEVCDVLARHDPARRVLEIDLRIRERVEGGL